MTLELTKASARKRTPITATTRLRVVDPATGIAYYRYDRRSKKRSPSDPDYYWVSLDEINCIAGPCQCTDYVLYRQHVPGDRCTHQEDAEEQMREKKANAQTRLNKALGEICV
jgi:hypothetical protein